MTIYKYLRLMTGLNQSDFAEKIKSDRAIVSKIELEKLDPWKKIAKQYAEFFKMKDYELLELADKFSNKSKQRKMINEIMESSLEIIKRG